MSVTLTVTASAAFATCTPSAPPDMSPIPTIASPFERYSRLVARDPYHFSETIWSEWANFVETLKHDPATPPALLAKSHLMLAVSLQQDDKITEGLSEAQEAERIYKTAGFTDDAFATELLTVLSSKETRAAKATAGETHAAAAMEMARTHFGEASWEFGYANVAAASAANALGKYREAERFAAVNELLTERCLGRGDPRLINRMSSHAAMLGMSGRLEESLAKNESAVALAIATVREDNPVMPFVLDNLGMSLRNAGRLMEAEAVLRRSLDLGAKYAKDDWYGRSNSLGKFGNVLDAQGRHLEAEAMWAKSAEFYAKTHDQSNPIAGSGVYRRAADAAQARGDINLALARREEALKQMAAAPPRHPEVARARVEYASTLLLAGRKSEAIAMASPAIAIIRSGQAETDPKRMGAEIAYARIVAALAGSETGYHIAAPVVHRLETKLLDSSASRGDLISYAPLFAGAFSPFVGFALATGRSDEAFHTLQLANLSEIALVNTATAMHAAASDPASRATVERLQAAAAERQLLDRERSFAIAKHDAATLSRIKAAIDANDTQIATASSELDTSFPAFRTLGRPIPKTLAAYQASLKPDEILLAPLVLTDGTLCVAITRDGFVWGKTAINSIAVRALVDRIRASMATEESTKFRRFDADAARRLYNALIPSNVAAVVRTHRHLLYYASGTLATIPPALLIEPSGRNGGRIPWLIRTHSITAIPSLIGPGRRVVPAPENLGFLGVGAPVLGASERRAFAARSSQLYRGLIHADILDNLPSLPNAEHELMQLGIAFGGTPRVMMIARDATETALKTNDLRSFGIIAIATHGLSNGTLPGLNEPALVMTPPITSTDLDDGLLTASEIAGLHLNADWVILSACNTAAGGTTGGATYSGLASAFMEAGARALLVSHWPVRDDAAEAITVTTLRETRHGVDRARALQHAILKLMENKFIQQSAHPAIWAPFVLIDR